MSNIHTHYWYTTRRQLIACTLRDLLGSRTHDLRDNSPQRPREDTLMPYYTAYTDDVDFVSNASLFLDEVQRIVRGCLSKWHLNINEAKTERSNIHRRNKHAREDWRMTSKRCSILGDAQDVALRKQLAAVAFWKLWSLWVRHHRVSQDLWLRLYNAFIVNVLTNNMGTWGLTPTEWARFDTFHRRHLRQIIGIIYLQRISNIALYLRATH